MGWRVVNASKGTTILTNGLVAETWWQRFRGLMGRGRLGPGEGLAIPQCPSIHTSWMRFPIDVMFLDRENRVVRVFENVKPFRVRLGGKAAESVVEAASGVIRTSSTQPGDQVVFEPGES